MTTATELREYCDQLRIQREEELEFPHDIYHQVGVNSLVKYENGRSTVVEGTSVYDLYPNKQ